jgi:uncharacterized protein (DUF2235 family)
MARNLIICLDGTANRFGRDNTNIVKLCECLDRNADQLVYYDPGVGTLGDAGALTWVRRKFTQTLGLAIGWGLMENVQQAYDFLSWHYRPEDRIFVFGFSRGAYTARALAALIHMYGLLPPGATNLTPYLADMVVDEGVDEVPNNAVTGGSSRRPRRWEIAASFKKHFGRPATIEFMGVFDTVASTGWFWNPLRLPFTSSNKSVKRVRHAVAIDERRGFFTPLLYKPEPTNYPSLNKLHGDIKEVWFAGVHSDVGGGYPRDEQALAQIPMEWMLREAAWLARDGDPGGLRLDQDKVNRVLDEKYAKDNPAAEQHWSLTPAWWLGEVFPRMGRRQGADQKWRNAVEVNLFRRRRVPKGAVIHRSVLDRARLRSDWRPPKLGDPGQYQVEE